MSIPQVDSCRFITIKGIKERIAEDNFAYKSVRVIGAVKTTDESSYLVLIENDNE